MPFLAIFVFLVLFPVFPRPFWITFFQCCGSGSGWIRIIWPDPDSLYETMKRIRYGSEKQIKNEPKLIFELIESFFNFKSLFW